MNWWAPLLALALVACGPPPPVAEPLEPDEPAGMLIRPVDADDPPEQVGVWYTVQKGDFLTALAQRYGVAPEDIVEANGLEHPERLEVGQKIFMPGIEKLVARAAPPPGQAKEPGKNPAKNPGKTPAAPVGKRPTKFVWPVIAGEVVVGFGKKQDHRGIDIKAPEKTPIYATADGVVAYADSKQPGYGHLIIIRHGGDVVSVYAHNRRNLVDEGDTVRQGQQIAEVGSSGKSRAPHLHFEIRMKGKPVDPLIYLPAR